MKSVSPFLKTQLIVVILTNASAVLNFLFQILISRKLDPKQLGIYFSVAAISQILFWIFNSVPQMVSHVMIFTEDQLTLRADSIKRLFKISLLFSAAIDVLVLLFAKKIQLFLNLESQLPVVFYVFTMTINFFVFFLAGILAGEHLFTELSFKDILISAAKITTFFFLFNILGNQSWVAFFSEALGALTALIFMIIIIRGKLQFKFEGKTDVKKVVFDSLTFGLIFTAVSGLLNLSVLIDVILAKRNLSEVDAGLFAGVSGLSKMPYFLCGALIQMLTPVVLKKRFEKSNWQKTTLVSFGLAMLISALFSLIIQLSPEKVISLSIGSKFVEMAGPFITLCWSSTLVSGIAILTTAFISGTRSSIFVALFALIITAKVAYMDFIGRSAVKIANANFYSNFGILMIILFVFMVHSKCRSCINEIKSSKL